MLQSTGVYINAPDPCVSLAVSSSNRVFAGSRACTPLHTEQRMTHVTS